MHIVPPSPPPKISEPELRVMRKEFLLIVASVGCFFLAVGFSLGIDISVWMRACLVISMLAAISFGVLARRLNVKRKETFGAKRDDKKIASDGGGGPLIH